VRITEARARRARALAADPPPSTAVVLLDRYGEIEHSSVDAERWLAEHSGAAEHPGWLPAPVADWLALPPRPALVGVRDGRRLTVRLLPGDPDALLLEEEVAGLRLEALRRLGLTARETEVLFAATAMNDEANIAWEWFLSLHAVRERLAHLEAKLGVRTAAEGVARERVESGCTGGNAAEASSTPASGDQGAAVSRGRVGRALAGLGGGGPRHLGRPARAP
jgi:DNA-binding CsgD family transcriptional regulator